MTVLTLFRPHPAPAHIPVARELTARLAACADRRDDIAVAEAARLLDGLGGSEPGRWLRRQMFAALMRELAGEVAG